MSRLLWSLYTVQFLNFNWTFHVGGSYAIYQFLLWICSNSKFFEVTGSIFLSAWGVRNFLSLLVSVHYMHPTKAFSIAFWDINIVTLAWNVITWENTGLVFQVHRTKWYFSCTSLVLWRKAENYALHREGSLLL